MPDDNATFSQPPQDDDNGLPSLSPSVDTSTPSNPAGLPPLTDTTPEIDLSSAPPAPTFSSPPSTTIPTPLTPLSDFEPPKPQPIATPHPSPANLPSTTLSSSKAPEFKPVKPTPATMPPKSKSSSGVAFSILGLLTLFFAAASAFLYTQNQALKRQLDTLTSIQEQREVPQVTPAPEASPSAVATISATPTPASNLPLSAFADLASIIALAQTESSTAQLLMITSDNILASTPMYKYWFRRGPGIKSYFFIQKTSNENPKLFSSATVSPDNDIPDLLPYQKSNQLGIDSNAAYDLAYNQLIKPRITATPSSVSAKYLRAIPSSPDATAATNLWQLTYKFPASASTSDVVVQIDAITKQILFSNLPAQATPTPTPTQ